MEASLLYEQLTAKDIIINEALEAVMITDPNGRILSVNRAFTTITGYLPDEVIGETPRILKSGVHTVTFYKDMFAALKKEHYWVGEIWNKRKNGEVFPQWGSITPVMDSQGQIKNYITVFSDISKAKQADERLYYLANHDPLTGLANRSKFVDFLNHALDRSRRYKDHKVAVAFIDLDRFKIINDTLGHTLGDQFLKAIATRLSSVCRNHDLLSRWGGDEFVLALDDISTNDSLADAIRRIIDVVKQPLYIDNHELEPTLSVGVSIFPDDGDNSNDLVRAADTAMYRVKDNGRNGFAFFTENQANESKRKFELVSVLNRALRLNEFELNYQPQVDAVSGTVVGLEALVRWNSPERGLLFPIDFIPQAEELGLINQIGEWVLRKACQQMAQWNNDGVKFHKMAVNLAPSQLNPSLIALVMRNLTENNLPASQLELELTEGALEQGQEVAQIMKQLREIGVALSIDDFGTGYSSLGHLRNFPITCFKIDKSFIDRLPGDAQDEAIVKTILNLGENFKVSVVVEGVEKQEQRDFLTSIGAKTIQGYFYSKPLCVTEITKVLKRGGF